MEDTRIKKKKTPTKFFLTCVNSLKQGRAPKIWQKIAEKKVFLFILYNIVRGNILKLSWYYNSNDHNFVLFIFELTLFVFLKLVKIAEALQKRRL